MKIYLFRDESSNVTPKAENISQNELNGLGGDYTGIIEQEFYKLM